MSISFKEFPAYNQFHKWNYQKKLTTQETKQEVEQREVSLAT